MSNLDELQQLNTNIPRETLVVATDGLVIKRPVIKNNVAPNKNWLQKQYHAQAVQESLQGNIGDNYFVPRMLEISDKKMFAIEERVPGHPITSAFFETLSDADKEIIYNGTAHFLNDINQSKPVLSQVEAFDIPEHTGDITFDRIVKHLKKEKLLSSKELDTLKKSKDWFDNAATHDASVVFCQADMNEHNIFYDTETKTLSFIDFADARYKNARDLFYSDMARLGWLDIEKLIDIYKTLPRTQPVIIQSNPMVARMRNALQNIKWCGIETITASPKLFPARLRILKDEIAALTRVYDSVKTNTAFKAATTSLEHAIVTKHTRQSFEKQK